MTGNECTCKEWRKYMGRDGELVFLIVHGSGWETNGSPEPFTFCPYCGKKLGYISGDEI
jgi:hypothetical protein